MTDESNHRIADGFTNVAKSIRTNRDPTSHGTYTHRPAITPQVLDAAYRTTWLARRIVDIVPEDATREWRSWKATTEEITELEKLEKRLLVQKKVGQAMTAARLKGGAALYMSIVGHEDLSFTPLRPEDMGKAQLKKLVVLGRGQLQADKQTINKDPDSDYYGEPELYCLSTNEGRPRLIHQSRLVRFWGCDAPEDYGFASDGWADSILEPLFDAVRDADAAMSNLASMIYEAKTDVVKIKNLMSSMLTQPQYEETLIRRFQIAALTKGTNGMLLLDEADQWDQKQLSFSGLPDVVDRFFQWVSGGAGIPVTRLFMRSPAGLNATGESDIRMYYDNVRNLQTNEIAPELEKLDNVMKVSVFGASRDDIFYEWNSLWQPTFDEKAESSKKLVEIAKGLVEAGLISTEALSEATANTLVEIGTFSGLEQALHKSGLLPEADDADDEEALPTVEQPPSNVVPLRAADEQLDDSLTQPRFPSGSPKGGQFAPKGGGTAKYSPDVIKQLLQKKTKDLSHYEKKVVAKYNKAMKSARGGTETSPTPAGKGAGTQHAKKASESPKKSSSAPDTHSKSAAHEAALAAVSSPKYPAEKLKELLEKPVAELSHYEKKKVSGYNKALKTELTKAPADSVARAAVVRAARADKPVSPPPSSFTSEKKEAYKKAVNKAKQPEPSNAPKYGENDNSQHMTMREVNGRHIKGVSDKRLDQSSLFKSVSMSYGEASAVNAYTGKGYINTNQRLRAGGKMTKDEKLMQKAIKQHKLESDATFVRGIRTNAAAELLSEAKVGTTFSDKGFGSVTRDVSIASEFADRYHGSKNQGTLLVINAKKGKSVLPAKAVSNYKAEDEFIMPAGSSFKVTKIDNKTRTVYVDLM